MPSSVQVLGIRELESAIARLRTFNSDQSAAVRKVDRKAARATRNIIRAETPKGPTGNLERAVQVRKFGGLTLVWINRKIAPHLHWVNFGARGGAMPANPFFDRGRNKSRGVVRATLTAGYKPIIEGLARGG